VAPLLRAFASGSAGNAYEVYDGATRILLECGLSENRLRAVCGRPLTDYAACLISHEHNDHSAAAHALAKRGVGVYASAGTMSALCLCGEFARELKTGEKTKVGTFQVKAFEVFHDVREPVGYLIRSTKTNQILVFATDTGYMKYTFDGATEIAVECNYSEAMLAESGLPDAVKARTRRTHFEVGRVIEWLAKCDLRECELIHLLHMSWEHSSAALFRDMVRAATGIETRVAGS